MDEDMIALIRTKYHSRIIQNVHDVSFMKGAATMFVILPDDSFTTIEVENVGAVLVFTDEGVEIGKMT